MTAAIVSGEPAAVIVGASGQLGSALQQVFPHAVALDRARLDVADAAAMRRYDWCGVQVLLNAAAYTQVDAAEDPAELGRVRAVNVDAVGRLAEIAEASEAVLVHISSEYVFDGTYPGPIPEGVLPSPLSVYGRSKADGDRVAVTAARHYLIRTTWVVGEGRNFVRTMASLADRGIRPAVVADQVGRPTFTRDLAAGIRHLVTSGAPYGTYNLTCEGSAASWADVAAAVFELRGRRPEDVRRVSTSDYFADKPHAAPRPLNSVLDLSKLASTGFRSRDWRPALAEYVDAVSPGGTRSDS